MDSCSTFWGSRSALCPKVLPARASFLDPSVSVPVLPIFDLLVKGPCCQNESSSVSLLSALSSLLLFGIESTFHNSFSLAEVEYTDHALIFAELIWPSSLWWCSWRRRFPLTTRMSSSSSVAYTSRPMWSFLDSTCIRNPRSIRRRVCTYPQL